MEELVEEIGRIRYALTRIANALEEEVTEMKRAHTALTDLTHEVRGLRDLGYDP